MAISEKRYAIELIDSDGNAAKFDNLDCMIRFAKERGVKNAGSVYLMDNSGKGWIRADEAYLVKSEQIHGPMGSGVVSFSALSAAEELAARYSARVRRFHEFWDR